MAEDGARDASSEDILSWVWDRIEADQTLEEDARFVVLAALEGEAALDALTGSASRPQRPAAEVTSVEPAGAFLKRITVRGFRGIGPEAKLTLTPRPGLTVIAGRNGSGKSSFAEALEVALTGTTYRWEKRTAQWKDAWRNLHEGSSPRIEVALAEEAVGTTRINVEWTGEELNERTTYLQRPQGKRERGLDSLGWSAPLAVYRPLLSYDELGGLLTARPSELYDALSIVLGLEQVTAAVKLLTDYEKRLGQRGAALKVAKTRLTADLNRVDDERARTALSLLAARKPDVEAMRGLATGTGSDDRLGAVLRQLAGITPPDTDTVETAASRLTRAVDRMAAASEGAAILLDTRARLLTLALEAYRQAGEIACPVCGEGTLDVDWADHARRELEDSHGATRQLSEARTELAAARQAVASLMTPPLTALAVEVPGLADEQAAATSAWEEWCAPPGDDLKLAQHVRERRTALAAALEELTTAATGIIETRDDAWTPAAEALAAYTRELEAWLLEEPLAKQARAARDWLKKNEVVLKNERVRPVADQAAAIWSDLRQESNVSIEGLELEGTATRRHVAIRASVDGSDSGALEVMSQGELHALALALFLPRATMRRSPFRFVVLDDPVQAMDPAKVDGLVNVLASIAESRQVVVFSHDDRLASAVRRGGVGATIVEVARQPGSKVEVINTFSPAKRYLRDAHGMVSDDGLPEDTLRRTLPGLLRLALEAQARDTYFSRELGAGAEHALVERTWSEARSTRDRVALALYGEKQSLDPWLDKKVVRKHGLGVCTSAVHQGLTGDGRSACEAVEGMVDDIVAGVR